MSGRQSLDDRLPLLERGNGPEGRGGQLHCDLAGQIGTAGLADTVREPSETAARAYPVVDEPGDG